MIISHRLKSIEKADKIVVLSQGKVQEIGNHDELMKTSTVYRQMVEKSEMAEEYIY